MEAGEKGHKDGCRKHDDELLESEKDELPEPGSLIGEEPSPVVTEPEAENPPEGAALTHRSSLPLGQKKGPSKWTVRKK